MKRPWRNGGAVAAKKKKLEEKTCNEK